MKVSIDELAKLIADDLAEYSEEVEEEIAITIDKVAQEALQATKDSAAISHLDHYKKGFYIKNEYKARGNKGQYKLRIAQRNYRIAHLLEHGHVTRNGGRTRAFPHWANGQKVANTLPDKIREALEK